MNYKQIHDDIISKAILENRIKTKEKYYERHHIIPRCLGGTDEISNLVLLTPKEHYLIHKLLVEFNNYNKSLWLAVHRMTYSKNFKNRRNYRISSRKYEHLKVINREIVSQQNKNRKISDETRIKISNSGKGKRAWNKGIKNCHNAEVIEKIKLAHIGKSRSEETKYKISKANSGENNGWHGKRLNKEEYFMFGKYGQLNPNFGSKRTEEQRKHISESLKDRKLSISHRKKISERMNSNHPMLNKHHSEETKLKMRQNHADYNGENHPRFGLKLSQSIKDKISEAHLKLSILKCPYCGLESKGRANMKRYHFENCKFKNI